MDQRYDTFFTTPTNTKSNCCHRPSTTPALLARFLLRTTIPIIIGVSTGMIVEGAERNAGMHNDTRLLEFSDFTSCAATLITTYTINALLNCCWPLNPYQTDDNHVGVSNA